MKITLLGTSHGDPTSSRLQSASVIETGDRRYLIDAGEGISTTLIRRGTGPETVDAVFITHMHLDHTGGLPELLELALKYRSRRPELKLPVFLPEARAGEIMKKWLEANYMRDPGANEIRVYSEGTVFDDGVLRVEAFPTRHLAWSSGVPDAKSYGFRITSGGKRVFFTGDLVGDFSDFPFEAASGCDALISELVHFSPEAARERMRGLTVGRLIFNHLGNRWQTEEGASTVLKLFSDAGFPVTVGSDGFAFDV